MPSYWGIRCRQYSSNPEPSLTQPARVTADTKSVVAKGAAPKKYITPQATKTALGETIEVVHGITKLSPVSTGLNTKRSGHASLAKSTDRLGRTMEVASESPLKKKTRAVPSAPATVHPNATEIKPTVLFDSDDKSAINRNDTTQCGVDSEAEDSTGAEESKMLPDLSISIQPSNQTPAPTTASSALSSLTAAATPLATTGPTVPRPGGGGPRTSIPARQRRLNSSITATPIITNPNRPAHPVSATDQKHSAHLSPTLGSTAAVPIRVGMEDGEENSAASEPSPYASTAKFIIPQEQKWNRIRPFMADAPPGGQRIGVTWHNRMIPRKETSVVIAIEQIIRSFQPEQFDRYRNKSHSKRNWWRVGPFGVARRCEEPPHHQSSGVDDAGYGL